MTRLGVAVLLVLIVVYASVGRFWGLTQKGFFFYDEAYLALETRYILDTLEAVASGQENIKAFLEKSSGMQLHYGRPGFNLASVLATLVLGYHDYTNFYLSAVLGVACVVAVFIMGTRFYGLSGGLLAAAFLSVFSYHLYYSRLGFAEAGGGFFLLLAGFFYLNFLKSHKALSLVLSGLFLGVTVTFGYRNIFWGLVFLGDQFLGDIFSAKKRRGLLFFIRNVSALLVPMAAVMLAVEGGFRVIHVLFNASSSETYFAQLAGRFTAAGYFSFKDWWAYFYYLFKSESLAFFLIFASAFVFWTVAAWKNRLFAARFIFLVAFTPIVFFSLYSTTSGAAQGGVFVRFCRSIAVSLPLVALAMGVFVAIFAKKLPVRGVMILAVLILVFQWPKNREIVVLQSGYRQAAQYLIKYGQGQVISFLNMPIGRFYLGQNVYSPKTESGLTQIVRERGVEYLLVDGLKYSWSQIRTQDFSYVADLIEGRRPAVRVNNGHWQNVLVLGEAFDLETIKKILGDEKARYIEIFSVGSLIPL